MLDKKTILTLFPGSLLFAPKPWERVTKLWARFLLSLCDDNAKCYLKMEKKFNPGLAPIGLSGTGASWSIQRMNSARWPEIMPSPFSLLSLYASLKEAKKQKNNNNQEGLAARSGTEFTWSPQLTNLAEWDWVPFPVKTNMAENADMEGR